MVQKGLIKGIQLVPRVKQGSTILSTSGALIRINTCMNYDEFYSTEHIAAVPIYIILKLKGCLTSIRRSNT